MNVLEMSDEQLGDLAKKYEIDVKGLSRKELEDKVQIAVNKRMQRLEEKAKAERMKEIELKLGIDPQTKQIPSPETIKIANSEKVYVLFFNREEEGVDVAFNKGCTHNFHLWDGFLHVMPKCVIDEFRDLSKPIGKRPRYQRRPHRSIPDMEIDTVVGYRDRFGFEVREEKPPKDAKFGVVLDSKIYDKLKVPFPQPVAHSA